MRNFWEKLKKPARGQARPFLALAPMAGITDQPFRLMCKKYGADVLYSEMISSEALYYNILTKKQRNNITLKHLNKKTGKQENTEAEKQLLKTLSLIQFSKKERPYVAQIFGSNPDHMANAAEYIASGKWKQDYLKFSIFNFQFSNKSQIQNFNNQINSLVIKNSLEIPSIPDGIDINMGCPAKDVVKTGAGSALMKDQENAVKIIKAIKKRVKNIPISVKTRLGWFNPKDILIFCRMLECAGIDALSIHGRTYKQGFSGKADWTNIYKVKKQLKIPVIGNGGIGYVEIVKDVKSVENAINTVSIRRSRFNDLDKFNILDGIMIGQGALGRPWIFEKCRIQNDECRMTNQSKTMTFIKQNILEHAKLVKEIKGERGIVEFRKHFGWYFKGCKNAKKIRSQLHQINTLEDVKNILSEI